MRLLIVEDENQIADTLKNALEKKHFAVDVAYDGLDGFQKAQINAYDCIVLDLNLPKMDGLEVAKKLREKNVKTSILMLTARTFSNNIYDGFENGADDYLKKPFDLKELIYRINALINRSSNSIPTKQLEVDDIILDLNALKVYKNKVEVDLNAKEYGILEYLLKNRGRIIGQEELLEHVWDEEIDTFTQTVKTNIKTLRKKIDNNKTILKTFRGRGYVID
jgi:DNA-binding response OmpR family regulator